LSVPEIINQFTYILRDLLGNDEIVLKADTRRENVPDWDSFNYLNFIIAIENRYGVKFPMSHIESFENVGAIAEDLAGRLTK
jgi:acyl carrier protein